MYIYCVLQTEEYTWCFGYYVFDPPNWALHVTWRTRWQH